MSIKSLWQKIALKQETGDRGGKSNEVYFIWHKNLPASRSDENGAMPVYDSKECLAQLEVIEHYINGFEKFRKALDEPKQDNSKKA